MNGTFVFDLATEQPLPHRDRLPKRAWRVVVQGEAVSLLATRRGKVVLVGSGRWSGKGIAQRYAVDDPISDRTWAKLENAIRLLEAPYGTPSTEAAAPAPVVDARSEVEPPLPAAAFEAVDHPTDHPTDPLPAAATPPTDPPPAPVAPSPPRDRRSGWWALGALLLTATGFVVSLKALRPDDSVGLAITVALGAGTLGFLIYGGYGLGTRCPSCKAWYRRETTSTETLGTSTTTRMVSVPITDSSGKQTGSRTEWHTFEVTRYRYHYRCKECGHRWTGTGSSERRIS